MGEFVQRTITETVKVLPIAMPRVIISAEAIAKMQLYIEGCSDEIGWLGTAIKQGNSYYILDTYLFAQEVHSTTTEITPDGLSAFGEEILQRADGMDIWNNLKVWGHSHVNMGVTPSGQDDSQMNTFKDGGHDWFIRIIGNKKGDLKIDIYSYETGVIYNDLKFLVGSTKKELELAEKIEKLENELRKLKSQRILSRKPEIEAEIKEKVKKKTWGVQRAFQQTTLGGYAPTWVQNANGSWVKNEIDYSKKNENVINEPKNERDSGRSAYAEQYAYGMDNAYVIACEQDVYFYIDASTIEEAATCRSIQEINEVLREGGYSPTDYDVHEKNLIMEVAQKDFKEKCKA